MTQAETPKATPKVSTYTAAELAEKSRQIFGKPPEVVYAAFKAVGKQSATLDEAKEIVNKFLQKEVQ